MSYGQSSISADFGRRWFLLHFTEASSCTPVHKRSIRNLSADDRRNPWGLIRKPTRPSSISESAKNRVTSSGVGSYRSSSRRQFNCLKSGALNRPFRQLVVIQRNVSLEWRTNSGWGQHFQIVSIRSSHVVADSSRACLQPEPPCVGVHIMPAAPGRDGAEKEPNPTTYPGTGARPKAFLYHSVKQTRPP